ncbi:SRPBCC family protein [Domibacillus indicus]|uniref:SRPBCC family protein n=1 Tax=Domibacillus indicus TaxID=1437523 RepID=UPI0006181ED0|nr:SRPBCC domain-containing protein [Domibacillus indicus]
MPEYKMNTKTEDRELIMEQVFDAPRTLVFQAFSKPEHLEAWWGPQGCETESRQFEFKPDGVWHFCMRCADKSQGEYYGEESWSKAVFHEVVQPERIMYTNLLTNEEGNIIEGTPSVQMDIQFAEDENRTRLIVRSRFASAEELQQVVEMGMVQGFSSQFNRLDDFLKELQ